MFIKIQNRQASPVIIPKHCLGLLENCLRLLISAFPPQDAGLLSDKGPSSHQSCHVAEAHAYLTYTCKGLMLLGTEGEEDKAGQ